MKKNNAFADLTVGSPPRRIVRFALPVLAGNFLQLLYSWTDAVILGNVRADAVQFAALSAALPVVNLFLSLLVGFLAGATVVLGQFFGKGDLSAVRRCYTTLTATVVVLALVVGAAGFFLCRPLLVLMRVDDVYLDLSALYLRYCFAGLLFSALYNALAQVLRSLGNSAAPLLFLALCVLFNVALDWLFAVVWQRGIEGVALGTLIAQGASAAAMSVYIRKKAPFLSRGKGEGFFHKNLLKTMLKIALPSTLQTLFICGGLTVINAVVNGNGKEFTAAFGLGNRVDEILSQVNNGFGVALTAYAAQNVGKRKVARVRSGYRAALLCNLSLLAFFAAVIYCFREAILRFFLRTDAADVLDGGEVMRIAEVFLQIYLPSFLLLGVLNTTACLLRGVGAARQAMTVNLCSFTFRVCFALLLNGVTPYGAFFASPIGWSLGAAWSLALYFSGRWRKAEILT